MATKQQIFVNNTLPTDKLLAGNGTDTLSEVTLGSGLSLSSGTLTATGGGSGSLIPLTTTIADCENTTSEIDIVTVTIPANTLAVGDVIVIDLYMRRLQNFSGTLGLTQSFYNGSSTLYASLNNTIGQSATVNSLIQSVSLIVSGISGDTVTLFYHGASTPSGVVSKTNTFALLATTAANGASVISLTNNTFDNTIGTSLKYSVQWASASSLAYIRVQQAQAYIIKKAV